MDEVIRATGVHHRALCPPFLMENLLHQAGALRGSACSPWRPPATGCLRTCATRDIGATAARLLLDGSWTGQDDVPLVGPDALTPRGMADVVAGCWTGPSASSGSAARSTRRHCCGTERARTGREALTDLMHATAEQGFYGGAAPSTPEHAPTSFRRWCEEVLRPAVLG